MKTHVHLTAADLCAVERTGSAPISTGHQHWTRGHSDAHGNRVVMYLSADEARDIALHFTKLAEAIDAEVAALDMEDVVA